jgi:DNA recombination protein RmuC
MELFLLLVVVLALVSFVLFKKIKDYKNIFTLNQDQNIELARLNERLNKFSTLETQLIKTNESIRLKDSEYQSLLNQKRSELTTLKEENSKANTSLLEQKEKYNDFKIINDKILDEVKDELGQLKITNSEYNEEIKNNKSLISQLKTQLQEQDKSMNEKIKLLSNSEEKLKVEFENLANKIFDNNSKKFKEQSQEGLGLILNPMKAQLIDFKKKVEDVYDKEAKDRSALVNELKTLKELNLKMSQDATNLTNALKHDNKTQGGWGEMVLDKVLENSGLREGHEFTKQASLRDDENKLFKPDVIVNLPDNRHIIIDAKTSLLAYNEYMASKDDEDRQLHLKNHIKSVKEHIKGLANKKYEDLKNINSLDFIFMFLPIESALLLALENDVNLYDEAFKQKIILVSPTTLLVALRAVENTWRYERQAKNIQDVYKRAEELYKKFTSFVDDLKRVDKGLESARTSYDEAFKKLSGGRGNLINQVTMLKQVSNIKPKKELDSSLVESSILSESEED